MIPSLGITAMLCVCSYDASSSNAASTAVACPASPAITPPAGAPPPGGAPSLVMSSTVRPSDTSTSTIISPNIASQITCGRTTVQTNNNVVYSTPALSTGATKTLAMDILVPQISRKKPLAIYVGGGGFAISAKEAALDQRTYVAEAGFVVASIQYRAAADGAVYSDSLIDVKSAIRYLRAHADVYGIDKRKVAMWGESSGGYLVAMAGLTHGWKRFERGENLDQSSDVQAIIDKYGPSDLSKIAADFDAATRAYWATPGIPTALYINGPHSTQSLIEDPTAHTVANPLSYLRASDSRFTDGGDSPAVSASDSRSTNAGGSASVGASDPRSTDTGDSQHVSANDPPFIVFHGDMDQFVSPSQTLILHDALVAAGVDSTRYVVSGANHGDMTVLGADPSTALPWTSTDVMGLMVNFLKKKLN
jgi:acetyl esterase/lipase